MNNEKFKFLNIEIDNLTFKQFLDKLETGVVVTPNVDHLIKLQKDKEFYECYQQAEHVVCDSRILLKLSKFLDKKSPIVDQIAGSDLFPAFCEHHKNNTDQMRVFLLGGTATSVETAKHRINKNTGSNIIVGAYSPPFGFDKNPEENARIIDLVRQSGATVLAVGVGAPKQEKWIHSHRLSLPEIKLFFAIGATIEFEAGGVSRSPKWMTTLGIEWLYRMSQEPGRLVKRYLIDDIGIFWLTLKQKMGWYQNPWGS